jgi:hypothetical protein
MVRRKPKGWRGNSAGHARAARLGHAHKHYHGRSKWQTGHSDYYADAKLSAKRPGKRRSKSGRVYYERRMSRSDMGSFV